MKSNDKWRKFSAAVGKRVSHEINKQMEPKIINNLFSFDETDEERAFFSRPIIKNNHPTKTFRAFRKEAQLVV